MGLLYGIQTKCSVNVSGYTLYRGTYDLFRESTDLSEIKNITGYVGDELGQEWIIC